MTLNGIDRPHRHWLSLAWRVAVLLRQGDRTLKLVSASYDRIAAGYDDVWTQHMRDLSMTMLDRLAPPARAVCIDLTCGTGFIAAELARRTGTRPVGVDASAGMIGVARRNHGGNCDFVQADALDFLRRLPPQSADVVTCGWGLGYTHPAPVVRQIARVLRSGGRVGIIDNTLFSLAGVLWASLKTFAERPGALKHAMNLRFLPGAWMLAVLCRIHGLGVRWQADGARTYHVPDGRSAIERLTATGAAAGFEFACDTEDRQAVFDRFAELLDERFINREVSFTHRWLVVIGAKP
jgi:SAM-dependent methyltransferase